ncbi:5'-nucleotidase [Cellulosimicrobium marinum]|uniref:5'-nucleotidase n=1 Tax=Cellulosimicrobium marinum TaxID=1638992 RepID=UPI001E3CC0F0|nr:5'-nucleotidase [Cellulosimicrobium marinum]MCB7137963.1 5'-nucleotidase [Cellulosimicrobium marinum]
MGYDLTGRLVVGVASSALFDLTDSDRVFRTDGEAAYRAFQEEHLDDPLRPGVAFGFVRRLLALNDLAPADDPLVEVIVMSRNSPETGLRVMRSVRHHDLAITRAVFRQGHTPYEFIRPLHMDLFLSADEASVRDAVDRGLPAGYVLDPTFADEDGDELRIAFDFDGVLADDSSERSFRAGDLEGYRRREEELADVPLGGGPLRDLLVGIHRVQEVERARRATDPAYVPRVHVALVTARSAPAHERAVATLKSWGVAVDDAFFLGGVDKSGILEVLRPHIFFDDQRAHVESARRAAPSVHVPYGALNRTGSPAPAPVPAPSVPVSTAPSAAPSTAPATDPAAVSSAPSAARPVATASGTSSDASPGGRTSGPTETAGRDADRADADPAPAGGAVPFAVPVPGVVGMSPVVPARPGTKEMPTVVRAPELTVLGRPPADPAAAGEASRRSRREEGRTDDTLPPPSPLPMRQPSGLARHR